MALRQRILPSRRDYNRWVANQTLEDYALRFTAVSARRWGNAQVANTALGATSFLALEAIGGAVTLTYGFANAAAAILAVGLLIFVTALPIAVCAARRGLDIDLLTRGAGFGYIGSTITSLVYATFTFIFFAIEASILAMALQICVGVPLWLGYVLSAAVVIPIVTHGITVIGRFQRWTQPVWIALNVLPFLAIAAHGNVGIAGWTTLAGAKAAGFALLPFGAAASVIVSLIAQVGEQVDFLRFMPEPKPGHRWRWWLAVIGAGPGWIGPGIIKLFAGSFLAWLAVRAGVPVARAIHPAVMYRVAFATVLPGWAAIAATGLFVVVAQLKINVTNAYAGSIAWSNFFARLTRSHPGRVVWVVFNVAIALLLMEIGLFEAIEGILALYSVLASAWVGALVADLVLVKPLGFAPGGFAFKRAHLYDLNPVGVGAMAIAVVMGLAAHLGLFGALARAGAPFLALFLAFAIAPIIAWATGGRFYLARRPRRNWETAAAGRECVVCGNVFEPQDTAFCPAYGGVICSLCCSLDARCHDACKPHGRTSSQMRAALGALVPQPLRPYVDGPLLRFLGIFTCATGVIGLILLGIYMQVATGNPAAETLLANAMWRAFFVLMIIAGVAAWLLVLAQETRAVAQRESSRQTSLLLTEIAAHKRTDAKLQKAKEAAEAANLAKSRFVVGISHELRTPLNAVLGYAQILDLDQTIPAHRREAIRTIRRSGEHLAGLIEGLLDISKIEAGRIEIDRREVRLADCLEQLVDMFRLQAMKKGITFSFELADHVPACVYTDETRLRQILINLLSNAVKFTRRGGVTLRVHRRGAVTEFAIEDTGIGIGAEDLNRVFEPFERVENHGGPAVPGVGLGLTITKLLTEILGGEILLRSRPGEGSCFRVRLLLAEVARPSAAPPARRRITGYAGRRRMVIAADDDATHRALLDETLSPLGIELLTVPDAPSCLRLAAECRPDAFILDLSMPGMDGWQLARQLREGMHETAVIVVVSAHPDDPAARFGERRLHDAFLPKPLDLDALLHTLGDRLGLEWTQEEPQHGPWCPHEAIPAPLLPHLDQLAHLIDIGHLSALRVRLDELDAAHPAAARFIAGMRAATEAFRLDELAGMIATARREAA
ncbi:MAG TPA: ATP-binding protein [Acetobacteraceae bacterium]|jgi:signal transduction histidine kinase/purine-cytosine permease-like protein/ActR/RegA family two-component response regulator